MHICFLSNEYPRPGQAHGGIGSFLKVVCPALVEAGHMVSVISGTYGVREQIYLDGVRLIYSPFSKKGGIAWIYNSRAVQGEIMRLNEECPVDLIEGSELSFAFIRKCTSIAYIIRLHGGHHFFAEGENRPINRWKGFQERRSFRKVDGFIGVSEYVVSHTSKFLKIAPRPVKVIMYPINLKLFSGAEFGLIEPYRLVFAGTIIEKKGIRQLCEAMEEVVSKFPQAVLHAYGRDWENSAGESYLANLKTQIPEGMKNHIIFHPPVDQQSLPDTYAKAHICVFPSHIETLGLVAPEAMAMNRAVLYTSIGPGPEVIEEGHSGWLCDPHDPKDIADKIMEIFGDFEEMKRRASLGKEKVNQQFNIKNILQQNLDFYQEVIKSKNSKN